MTSGGPNIDLAARRVLELESLATRLGSSRRKVEDKEETCITLYERPYHGVRDIRKELKNCEWALYNHVSLVHMLNEILDRTNDEFSVSANSYAPPKHEFPELTGIRHCIHHRGLVGLNIAEYDDDFFVAIPLESIRKHGSWGDGNSKFSTHFHSVTGNALIIKSLLKDAEGKYKNLIYEVIEQLEDEFGESELKKAASNVDIYLG